MQKEVITDMENSSQHMYIKYRKVKDHCHYTGKYRGAAYNICNLRYKSQKKFLLFFIMVLHMIIIL